MSGSSESRQRATAQAFSIVPGGDSVRRRSLQSFLLWPFLLGAAFASDDLSAIASANADERSEPVSPTSEGTHSPPIDMSLDPVRLSDWEANNSDQSTQNLLPGPHSPDALAAGGLEHPVAPTLLGTLQAPNGGGAGSSSGGGEAEAGAHAGSSIDPGAIDGGSSVGESPSPVWISVSGNEFGVMSAHVSGDALASGGTIAFGTILPESFMPQLTINGGYTDFGIALQASNADTHVASIDYPHGALMDLGHPLDPHDPASTASIHLNDDTNLRAPTDLWG
jgi:hypothetical protein